jgi:hypothetical protein
MKKIAACVVILALLLGMRSCVSPPDWVEVHLSHVPNHIELIYVIAEDHGRVRALHWYHSKVFPFTDDPREAGEEWYNTGEESERKGDIQWANASRHGILARKKDGKWLLWWLAPKDRDGPSPLRYLFGADQARIRVPDESLAEIPRGGLIEEINIPDDEKKAIRTFQRAGE